MVCTICGKNLPDDAEFCEYCGASLSPTPNPTPETPIILPEAPEIPTGDETVIVPQIPSEPGEKSPSGNPTIVVPKVTGKDALDELYPNTPKKNENNLTLIIGLVAAAVVLFASIVVVVLGVMNNWWRTTPVDDGKETSSTTASTAPTDPVDPDEPGTDENLTAEQLRDQLTEFTANGLKIYLSDDFEEVDSDEMSTTFESDDLEVLVFWGPLAELDKDIETSREFAKAYEDSMAEEFDDIQRTRKHEIYYTVGTKGNRVTVAGFYVKNGFGWMIEIETKDYESRKDELINYVTLGLVDAGFTPPADAVEKKEFTFAGLSLTLDGSLTATQIDDHCIYQNDDVTVTVQFTSVTEVPAATSKAYAEWVLDAYQESGWKTLYMDTADEKFYYVAAADDEGMVSMIGMYTHGDAAWIVTADTQKGDQYATALLEYITSGRIIPEEIPEIQQNLKVEFAGMQLDLFGAFKETYRDTDYVRLSDGKLDVFIKHGSYANTANAPISAQEMAQRDYNSAKNLWDNVDMSSLMNVHYLATWENSEDAVNVVQGYYLVGDSWWIIRVEAAGSDNLEDMLTIAVNGVITQTIPDEKPTFQRGELVKRNRIVMKGQSTAEYQGLQINYSPDWLADTTWGPTGDYYNDKFTMFTHKFELSDMGVSNALDMAWKEAEDLYLLWDSYEVGIAGGVPYLLLCDETAESYSVLGIYDDGTNCWEISVSVADAKLVDQAIWYATAGVVVSDSAA